MQILRTLALALFVQVTVLSSCTTVDQSSGHQRIPDISGVWSNEGDVAAKSDTIIDIEQKGDRFDGTLRHSQYRQPGRNDHHLLYSTGLASITDGSFARGHGIFRIYSPRGTMIGTGRIIPKGRSMRISISISGQPVHHGVLWTIPDRY